MAEEKRQQKNIRYSNPYADYEYIGKSSREPWRVLILPLILGILLFWFAWTRWHEINAAELTGSSLSMSSVEWGLYKISGKWGLSMLLAAVGGMFVYFGIHNYLRLQKMKRS